MALVEGQRSQGRGFDILLAEHEAFGERRALIGKIGLVANQGDPPLIPFHAQRQRQPGSRLVRLRRSPHRPMSFVMRAPSLLRLRCPHDQAVQFLGDRDLAAQTAIRPALGSRGVEHLDPRLPGSASAVREQRLVDINVAGGALARAATFGDNAVHSILDGAFHHRVADRNGDLTSVARVRDVGHRGGVCLLFSKEAHDCRLGALTTVRHFRLLAEQLPATARARSRTTAGVIEGRLDMRVERSTPRSLRKSAAKITSNRIHRPPDVKRRYRRDGPLTDASRPSQRENILGSKHLVKAKANRNFSQDLCEASRTKMADAQYAPPVIGCPARSNRSSTIGYGSLHGLK